MEYLKDYCMASWNIPIILDWLQMTSLAAEERCPIKKWAVISQCTTRWSHEPQSLSVKPHFQPATLLHWRITLQWVRVKVSLSYSSRQSERPLKSSVSRKYRAEVLPRSWPHLLRPPPCAPHLQKTQGRDEWSESNSRKWSHRVKLESTLIYQQSMTHLLNSDPFPILSIHHCF